VTGMLIGGSVSAHEPLVARRPAAWRRADLRHLLGLFRQGLPLSGRSNITEVSKRLRASRGARLRDLDAGAIYRWRRLSTKRGADRGGPGACGVGVWSWRRRVFNIGVPLSAPRAVGGRSLAGSGFESPGDAIVSWAGGIPDSYGVEIALMVSRDLMLLSPILGIWCGMPRSAAATRAATEVLADPSAIIADGASGPLCGRDRISVAQERPPCSTMCDAGKCSQQPAQRRIWLAIAANNCR